MALPKSLAANFRFQSCIARRVGAARSQVATRGKHRREESPSLAGLTTCKCGWLALSPLAPLGVVGFIFFRRQLLKIFGAAPMLPLGGAAFLTACGGSDGAVTANFVSAEFIGMERSALHRKLKSLGVE